MGADRAVVIGAGVAGLAAAGALAARGLDVVVLESEPGVGGKMRETRLADGRGVDSGPTVLTLRPVLEEAFGAAGARLEDHVRLVRAEVLARHAWSDGGRLDLWADPARSEAAIGEFAGAGAAAEFRSFTQDARHAFQTLYAPFMRRPAPSFAGLLLRAGPAALSRIDPYASFARHLRRRFTDPRLRQLFGRYATYVGASPFDAPATLMLVADVEAQGVWLVEGGMARLAEGLARSAELAGAQIRRAAPAAAIEVTHGRAVAVHLRDGGRLAADLVLSAVDLPTLQSGAFGLRARSGLGRPPARNRRSLSAVTWAGEARITGWTPSRHSVLFSDDEAAEFAALAAGRMPPDPTVYLHAQDRPASATLEMSASAPPTAPSAQGERVFLLVNAPALGDDTADGALEIEACHARMMRRLRRCGLELEATAPLTPTTPADFARRAPATGGALYGPPTRGWTSAFRRPGVRSPTPGLYLAGGGAHPGPGVPMAALSGLLAAEAALKDLTSRRPSVPTATRGGTSMR